MDEIHGTTTFFVNYSELFWRKATTNKKMICWNLSFEFEKKNQNSLCNQIKKTSSFFTKFQASALENWKNSATTNVWKESGCCTITSNVKIEISKKRENISSLLSNATQFEIHFLRKKHWFLTSETSSENFSICTFFHWFLEHSRSIFMDLKSDGLSSLATFFFSCDFIS